MNFLAHAYLSFNDPEVVVGNLISDFVKGKKQYDYTGKIFTGIKLHRLIDAYTDAHEATKQANEFLTPATGLYAGAFTDVVYDHFLANDETYWKEKPLQEFVDGIYEVLKNNTETAPTKFTSMLPYMFAENWLYNYKYRWGIEKSFTGITRRAKYLNDATHAFELFEKNYTSFEKLSAQFLPDIKNYALTQLNIMLAA